MLPSRKLHRDTVLSFLSIALSAEGPIKYKRPTNKTAEAKLVQPSSLASFYNIAVTFSFVVILL